jgi:hypothetical protein
MRIAAAALLLLAAAACGPAEPVAQPTNGAAAPPPGAPDNRIECQVRGSATFARACSLATAERSDGLVLTIRKADGGFRRLFVANDDRGVIAADGSEQADITLLGDGRIEVAIGGDRFRLPSPGGR